MKLSHDELAQLYRDANKRDDEVEKKAIADAASGDSVRRAKEELARRLAQSTHDAEDYRLAKAVHYAQGVNTKPKRRLPKWTSAAAGIAAGLVLGAWLLTQPAPTEVRRDEAYSPPNAAVLDAAPREFLFPEVPGATAYRVRLIDSSGEMVWESRWQETSPILGPAEPLSPGEYLWQVKTQPESAQSTVSQQLTIEP